MSLSPDEYVNDLNRIRQMRLMNDEFMSVVFSDNPEAAELVLQIILEEPTLKIEHSYTQEKIANLFGRDVILDVFCTDAEGRVFNVEIQRSDKGAAPRRARYHASLLDQKLLRPGEWFDALPETYVIFITERDYYNLQCPIYHAERKVLETGLSFDDGQHIIYVSGDNESDTPLGLLMSDFRSSGTEDIHYDVLKKAIGYYKYTEEGRASMSREFDAMCEEYRERGIIEGIALGEAQGEAKEQRNAIKNLMTVGQTAEQIIQQFDYPEALVREVAATQQ